MKKSCFCNCLAVRIAMFIGALVALWVGYQQHAEAVTLPHEIDVGALHVEQVSDKGPAIIFIPGLASGPWAWADTIARLKGNHTVFAVTLPGFDGRKPRPGVKLDDIEEALRVLIESKHIKHPVLVGHSLGGTLALRFATQHSDLISGVVALEGLPVFPGTENVTGDRAPLGARMRTQMSNQTQDQFALQQTNYMVLIGSTDDATARRLASFAARSDPEATADFAAQIIELDFRAALGGIAVPVLEVVPYNAPDGERIGVTEARKLDYYRSLLTGIKQLNVASLTPARHFAMFDQPDAFAEMLDTALADMYAAQAKAAAKKKSAGK
jgi:pimeloyl-ACP methyl ester carboxylesterase